MNTENPQIMYMLGEIKSEISSINKKMDENIDRYEKIDAKIEEMQKEIGKLNQWKANLMGKLVVLQAVFATFVGFIFKQIKL